MKSVFGILGGDYEDYSVRYVCPTREVAVAVVEKLNRLIGRSDDDPYVYDIQELPFVESPEEVSEPPQQIRNADA